MDRKNTWPCPTALGPKAARMAGRTRGCIACTSSKNWKCSFTVSRKIQKKCTRNCSPLSRKFVMAWKSRTVLLISQPATSAARRLNIKYRRADGGSEFAHTLNGTAVVLSRFPIAIFETHQQADGSVRVPKVLQKYTGFDMIAKK